MKNTINDLYVHMLKLLAKLQIGRRIHYIGGSDILPPPLPPQEEKELIDRLTEKDMEARQTLIEHNLRLVVYIAKKFENSGVGIEDLISIGAIGLIKAVNTFDSVSYTHLRRYCRRRQYDH